MDFITTGIIASSAYELFKEGLKLGADTLKERLNKWIKDDVVAESVASELAKLGINEDMSERAMIRRLEGSNEITQIVKDINETVSVVAPSTITNMTQNHSGTGDNIGGNKISR